MPETTNGQAAALWGGISMSVTGLVTALGAWSQAPPYKPGLWIGVALIALSAACIAVRGVPFMESEYLFVEVGGEMVRGHADKYVVALV